MAFYLSTCPNVSSMPECLLKKMDRSGQYLSILNESVHF